MGESVVFAFSPVVLSVVCRVLGEMEEMHRGCPVIWSTWLSVHCNVDCVGLDSM